MTYFCLGRSLVKYKVSDFGELVFDGVVDSTTCCMILALFYLLLLFCDIQHKEQCNSLCASSFPSSPSDVFYGSLLFFFFLLSWPGSRLVSLHFDAQYGLRPFPLTTHSYSAAFYKHQRGLDRLAAWDLNHETE